MKIKHGTAIYTGGGIYVVIGEIGDGKWFIGNNDFCEVINFDVKTKMKDMAYLKKDTYLYDNEDDLAIFYLDLTEEEGTVIKTDAREKYEMYYDFCKRLDKEEPNITDGYEEYTNYLRGELCDYIDFSYFYELDDGVKEFSKRYPEEFRENMKEDLDDAIMNILAKVQDRLNINSGDIDPLMELDLQEAEDKLIETMVKVLDFQMIEEDE